jgi:hypothetical protein
MLCPVVVRIDTDADARVGAAVRVRIEIVMSRRAE